MGVESYLLRLKGNQGVRTVGEYLTSVLSAQPDASQYRLSDNYEYYVVHDGRHVIEFEVASSIAEQAELSIRFAICHPASVDDVFVDVVVSLMTRLGMTATICEELPTGAPCDYSAKDTSGIAINCRWSIARAREQWRKQFGPEEAGLSVADACRKFYYESAGLHAVS